MELVAVGPRDEKKRKAMVLLSRSEASIEAAMGDVDAIEAAMGREKRRRKRGRSLLLGVPVLLPAILLPLDGPLMRAQKAGALGPARAPSPKINNC